MIFIATFFAIAAVTAASTSSRIVNGNDAEYGEWPFQASLQQGGSHICGATILSENVVMTAAHCVNPLHPGDYRVVTGEHDRSSEYGTEQFLGVARIIVHGAYDTSAITSDIAILFLTNPAVLDIYTQPVALDDNSITSWGDCYITGWGRLSGGGELPNVLQEVQTKEVGHSACVNGLGLIGLLYLKIDHHICVAGTGHSACNGDSGGPFVCLHDGKWIQRGITSWGLSGCPPDSPSVYARVSNYRQWIKDVTGL